MVRGGKSHKYNATKHVLYTTDQELMVKGAKIHNRNTPKHAYYTTDQGCTVFAKIQNHNTIMVHK